MALFVIPRYVVHGEEGDLVLPLESKSRELLRRLQDRVRTPPRRSHETPPGSAVPGKRCRLKPEGDGSEENESEGPPPKKRRRKKRHENGGSEEPDAEEEEETGGDPSVPASSPNPPPSPLTSIVLGRHSWKSAGKVTPHLPPWLAHPVLFPGRIKGNVVPLRDVPQIHPRLVKKLQANGITSLFPVQAAVIPAILSGAAGGGFLTGRGGYPPGDLCVSAPTGSGKTLAFVLPIVQALLERVVSQVRALVVLPTKELAQQVTKVFGLFSEGTGLKVAEIAGRKPFAREQEALLEGSLADIVVATPGRLVDHLRQTPGFGLRQLRFLVIDEADWMIDGMHQDWLREVEAAALRGEEGGVGKGVLGRDGKGGHTAAGAWLPSLPLQKLLFSATMTRQAEKLQPLRLCRPRLFLPEEEEEEEEEKEEEGEEKGGEEEKEKKYALPEGLSHFFVPCSLRWKPLYLLHFLLRLRFPRVLCFANSRDTAHRLFLLVQAFGGVPAAEFSSRLTPEKRKRTLRDFETGKIRLLISTDATARGIDVAGVGCVVSYDAPLFIRTYVHRVGRTARGGKAGLAFTMLLKQQESRFLRMAKEAGLPVLGRHFVGGHEIQPLLPRYQQALDRLRAALKEERAERRS